MQTISDPHFSLRRAVSGTVFARRLYALDYGKQSDDYCMIGPTRFTASVSGTVFARRLCALDYGKQSDARRRYALDYGKQSDD